MSIETAKAAGIEARQAGKTLASNPYGSGGGELSAAWRDGWINEDADIGSYSGPSIYPSPSIFNDD